MNLIKLLAVTALATAVIATSVAAPDSALTTQVSASYSISEAESFKQYDSDYASTRFGQSATIGSKGCLITSLAIQLNRSGSWNGSPSDIAYWLNNNGGFVGNSYIWASVNKLNGGSFKYVTSYALSGTNAQKEAKISGYMNQGYYCIVSVKNYGHFVAVKPSGNSVVMMDPNSTRTDLFSYWGVNRVYLFSSTASKEGTAAPAPSVSVPTLTLNDLPENGTIEARTISTGTIRELYSDTGLTCRMSGSEIWSTDNIRILEITNSYVKVSYPAGSRWKTTYVSPDKIFNSTQATRASVKYNVNVYAKYNSSVKYGCAYTTDTVYAFGTRNGRVQIFYNTAKGWKLGWIPQSAIR